MDLHDKTVIVTGASRGIGKQVAIEMGRRGANVVVAARTVEARRRLPGTVGETVAAIEAVGGRALAVAADMADPDHLDHLVSATVGEFGRVDVLFNNAAATTGRSWGAPLSQLTREEWMYQFAVNLHAPFTLTRAVAPIMAAQGGGRIINVTSGDSDNADGASLGLTKPLAYPSSKAALDQFCRSVAAQLRPLGVSIVNVNPGFVHTELVDLLADGGVDVSQSINIDIPVRALAHLAGCDDPMVFSGQILTAETMVNELGL